MRRALETARALGGNLRHWLARHLLRLGRALDGRSPSSTALESTAGLVMAEPSQAAAPASFAPATREPLTVQQAVLSRDLSVLKREAADALAALGAAHALVSSARLGQLQQWRGAAGRGEVPEQALLALAADYQGWQNDQVRLFDALSLVLRMKVPPGKVLDLMDPGLHEQAQKHLDALSVEYQRRVLEQFPGPSQSA